MARLAATMAVWVMVSSLGWFWRTPNPLWSLALKTTDRD